MRAPILLFTLIVLSLSVTSNVSPKDVCDAEELRCTGCSTGPSAQRKQLYERGARTPSPTPPGRVHCRVLLTPGSHVSLASGAGFVRPSFLRLTVLAACWSGGCCSVKLCCISSGLCIPTPPPIVPIILCDRHGPHLYLLELGSADTFCE